MLHKKYALMGLVVSLCLSHSAFSNEGKDRMSWNKETKKQHWRKVPPSTDQNYYFNGEQPAAKVELGRQLYFDKILSGNLNISCGSCHHSMAGTGDGLSLPVGEGGRGLGVNRDTGHGSDAIHERVPRNAPHVFNLGASEFEVMFADGRVAVDDNEPSGFLSPAGADLPAGLDNVLAAQAMFPVTSGAEMAGQPGENLQADLAAAGDLPALWIFLAEKLQAVPGYVDLFKAAFDDISQPEDITYVHAANAIAAFEAVSWRFDNSPFDQFLRGDRGALSANEKRGMRLFYGEAGCSSCHSGTYQTDHDFHAIAMPQIGPGKGDGASGHEDYGREQVTGNVLDRFKFRTPSLRNAVLTAPYGHSGAYNTLEGMVKHHLDSVDRLEAYDTSQAMMPNRADLDSIDYLVHNDPALRDDIANASELSPRHLSEKKLGYLMDFLHALTDRDALDMRTDIPRQAISGLPIYD